MLFTFLIHCTASKFDSSTPQDTDVISSSEQRTGDPDQGLWYLLYGDYLGSGIPREIYEEYFGATTYNPLGRTGDAASVPYPFNIFNAPNGVEVVGGINCFGCHANTVNGEFYIGIGSSFSDYTSDDSAAYIILNSQISNRYGTDSPEWEAYRNLGEASVQIGPNIVTPFAGINPAFALEEAATQYRDPETLIRQDEPVFELGSGLASDVPPWWHIQKKNALYYNGLGRGDMAKLIMQICVVGVWDSDHAAQIEANFPDVLAYLMTIQPPDYPLPINTELATTGEELFSTQCAYCHGTYGEVETYPNRLVPVDEVGTDPRLARSYIQDTGFLDWLQESWFAQSSHPAQFVAEEGYLAPPLDGIWITAPYLHNGSVPNLYMLLDSTSRPTFWSRDFGSSAYDLSTVGWPFEEQTGAIDESTYNTTKFGYGNQGHTYGDHLSTTEREALIEYLKTL